MACRCVLIILDSLGIGALPDAVAYSDEGSDTLGHICSSQHLEIPNLERLGLGCIRPLDQVRSIPDPQACFGRMVERSAGKDSTTGHWEIAGLITDQPFQTFPAGFPVSLIKRFEDEAGVQVLGNKPASGTEIIQELGQEHLRTGRPIVYTSADPVLQIAAHEDIVPLDRLYELCEIAFGIAVPYGINRVIARPFLGTFPNFKRTEHRRDFSAVPPAPTVLDALIQHQVPVVAVGKVGQIFAGRGISASYESKSNQAGIEQTIALLSELSHGLIFTNLVDFDMLFGHRRDAAGYARAIQEFDRSLPRIIAGL